MIHTWGNMRLKISFVTLLSFATSLLAQNVTCPTPIIPTAWPTASSFPVASTLPDPFTYLYPSTARVASSEEWYACRQPQILQLLQQYQYGYYPDHSLETVTATRSGTTVSIRVTAGGKTGTFSAQIFLPNPRPADPVGVVIAIGGIDNNAYLSNGIAVVTFDYTAVAPDSNSKTGAFWALYNGRDIGTLTAWAWGFHRVLDALILTAPEINSKFVGVTGCSRLGKAALAAGLFDTRITLTMPMSSGIQGLGPYRYSTLSGQGETLENSKQGAPWWSSSALGTFINQSNKVPFDAHTIAAALAPRALIIDQGSSDPYVNSKGTAVVVFPAAKAVYDWLGVGSNIGVAIRSGGHCDNAGYTNVLPFVLKVFKGTPTTRTFTDLSPWQAMPTAYPWTSNIPPK